MKLSMICMAAAGIALAAPAFAADKVSSESDSKVSIEKDANGNVHQERKTTAETTDTHGTTSTETKIKVDADPNGNGEKSVTTETVNDPKGLMNETKTETTDVVKHRNGENIVTHKKKVNGTVVENTTQEGSR